MIVTYDEKRMAVEVKGHAGVAEAGKDIVCAAASMCIMMLINSLKDISADFDCVINDGYSLVRIKETSSYAEFAFRYTVDGLKLLSEFYPGNVTVSEFVQN